MLDAPVSGGEIGAIDGTLSPSWSAATPPRSSQVRAGPAAMGKPERIVHVGESGAGPDLQGLQSDRARRDDGGRRPRRFALARKTGVDPMKVRAALMGGFAQSRVLEVHGERMITGNCKPGFKAKLFKKDLGIALDALAEDGVPARRRRLSRSWCWRRWPRGMERTTTPRLPRSCSIWPGSRALRGAAAERPTRRRARER